MKLTHKLRISLLPMLAAVLLPGCASQPAMRTSLTEMGTTSNSEYGAYGMRMMRAINVAGTGADERVGDLTLDVDKFSLAEQLRRLWLARKDLPDSMNLHFSPDGKTKVVQKKLCNSCNDLHLSDLTNIRDKVEIYQAKITQLAQDKLKQAILENTQARYAAETDDKKKTEILNAVTQLYPDLKQADLTSNYDKTMAALDTSSKSADKTLQEIKAFTNKAGVIITSWERNTALTSSLNAGEVANGSFSNKKTVSGFLIMGDPVIYSLKVGKDLKDIIEKNEIIKTASAPKQVGKTLYLDRVYMNYYQLRAKYLVYAEQQQRQTMVAINAKLDEIAKKANQLIGGTIVPAKLLEEIKLDVAVQYGSVTNLASSGQLEGVIVSEVDLEKFNQNDETLPVINNRASVDKLLEILPH